VIADSVIAVPLAAPKPGANNAAAPIAATSIVRKGCSIIGRGKRNTAAGKLEPA